MLQNTLPETQLLPEVKWEKKTERQMGNERSNSRNEKKSVGVEVSACIGRGGGRRVCRSQSRREESEGEEKVGGETGERK